MVKSKQTRLASSSYKFQTGSGEGSSVILPQSPFTMSKTNLVLANKRSLNVKAPSNMDWRPSKLFGKDASHFKSNQWKHILASGILKFCVRGLIGVQQEKTLIELCNVAAILCSGEVALQNMDAVEYRVHRVLSLRVLHIATIKICRNVQPYRLYYKTLNHTVTTNDIHYYHQATIAS